jgi:hypothetical protein
MFDRSATEFVGLSYVIFILALKKLESTRSGGHPLQYHECSDGCIFFISTLITPYRHTVHVSLEDNCNIAK